jgi:cytoskeleton protein RodZ
VQTGIGATLREARNRRKIDLSEVEAAIKIRARYLRAIENEEWELLPGGAYTRGFIRTYAVHLGLDGERLADEYRHRVAAGEPRGPSAQGPAGIARTAPAAPRLTGPMQAAIVSLGLIAALIAIVLIIKGGDSGTESTVRPNAVRNSGGKAPAALTGVRAEPGTAVQLSATAEVWVCLLDANGQPLVNGRVLEAGAEEGPFRSDSFTVSFGNGEVAMRIDGKEADIPTTSSPIGYEISPDGELQPLSEVERPTCT